MYVVSVAASQKGSRLQEGGAASEWRDGKERGRERWRWGGCLSEMSVGVPLKEYCLTDNTPGFAGIIRAGFTGGGALSQTG